MLYYTSFYYVPLVTRIVCKYADNEHGSVWQLPAFLILLAHRMILMHSLHNNNIRLQGLYIPLLLFCAGFLALFVLLVFSTLLPLSVLVLRFFLSLLQFLSSGLALPTGASLDWFVGRLVGWLVFKKKLL